MPATTRIPGQVLISQVGFEGGKKIQPWHEKSSWQPFLRNEFSSCWSLTQKPTKKKTI